MISEEMPPWEGNKAVQLLETHWELLLSEQICL